MARGKESKNGGATSLVVADYIEARGARALREELDFLGLPV